MYMYIFVTRACDAGRDPVVPPVFSNGGRSPTTPTARQREPGARDGALSNTRRGA